MGFTKLWCDIVMSTIWREDDKTRLVWITMLASSDALGNVGASVPGLADAARVSIPDCKMALHKLMQPDPDSRSKEFEGRRIQEIDGGWQILNYVKWREKGRGQDRREYFKEYRRRLKLSSRAHVCNQKQPIAEADAEADAED